MSINITTGYPVRTGDSSKDFEYLYSSFCSLIDELTFALPQLSGQVDALGMAGETTDSESEN